MQEPLSIEMRPLSGFLKTIGVYEVEMSLNVITIVNPQFFCFLKTSKWTNFIANICVIFTES